jgi:hypothetical protein
MRICRCLVFSGLMCLVVAPAGSGAELEASDAGLTALFVRYYSAVAHGRWSEAFQLLHDRLKAATEVHSPDDLAQASVRSQQELIHAFQSFDRLEVIKTEMDLTSIKAHVKAAGDGNVAGKVTYDLVVFPKSAGRSLMYRVVMDIGLAGGRIIRMTQHSMARIDPGGIGDAV